MTVTNLPKGWTTTSIGDVATYQNGRAFKPSEWDSKGLPIIRIQNLNDTNANYNFSHDHHEEKFKVKNGDLLFAWSASLGAYIWRGQEAWLNQHIFRVDHTNFIDRLFLFYALKNITAELYAKTHGSGMVHVTKEKFRETPLSLPPLSEQHRIVAKIEELFSELDKGIDSLKTARAQLNVYRQAVLKHAFEGKLTAQWREQNKDKLENPEQMLTRIKREREDRCNSNSHYGNGQSLHALTVVETSQTRSGNEPQYRFLCLIGARNGRDNFRSIRSATIMRIAAAARLPLMTGKGLSPSGE